MLDNKTIAELDEAERKATPGPWVTGCWNILDEDRPAQKRGEPYWTLQSSECITDGLMRGPVNRKSKDTEYIIQPLGYETDGIEISDADATLITLTRNNLRSLLDEVKTLRLYRDGVVVMLKQAHLEDEKRENESRRIHRENEHAYATTKKLRAELKAAREQLALIADGEGPDAEVYMQISRAQVKHIDASGLLKEK